eukprot:6794933-Pyramimonas_sp.AAC.1
MNGARERRRRGARGSVAGMGIGAGMIYGRGGLDWDERLRCQRGRGLGVKKQETKRDDSKQGQHRYKRDIRERRSFCFS